MISVENLEQWFASNYERTISGRYILYNNIKSLIEELPSCYKNELLGFSTNGIPIHKISFGTGLKKVLIWSQMHGNECTGTKALFDLFKFLTPSNTIFREVIAEISKKCTIEIIPMLNPDGAIAFTRENAVGIDLNRDAVKKDAIESNLLRNTLEEFNPQFCFNLHDQRSIFNVEDSSNPATISFLAPSEDVERNLTDGRIETMSVIVAMNNFLQKLIPNQIGRYTDEFYPTATGDNFQKLGHNTILIEAGHYFDDYDREITRKYNFYALLSGLLFIATSSDYKNYESYMSIPNNNTKYLDVIYKNVSTKINDKIIVEDIGIQFKFKVIDGELVKYQHIENRGDLSNYYSNTIINAEYLNFSELLLSNS
ncbi:M14 family zinc carboxypeptidase [Lutibacter sp.]|uniref:M14 family zinc carboxypeptidase n=1 Tax=Lutibacter sp. TaxID=1925666 RepID=UPI0027356694|nr:M14 family zinc carboxypeptidase [Lutibacter sp.]MDP3313252.1 M14 family zinc carboxypeptidase [Lutibacter sp.]